MLNKFNILIRKLIHSREDPLAKSLLVNLDKKETVCTDGYVLGRVTISNPNDISFVAKKIFIPIEDLENLKDNKNDIKIDQKDKHIVINSKEIKILKEQEYPDYEKIIPKSSPKITYYIYISYLKKIANLLAEFTKGVSEAVKLQIWDSEKPMIFTACNEKTGQSMQIILAPYKSSGILDYPKTEKGGKNVEHTK